MAALPGADIKFDNNVILANFWFNGIMISEKPQTKQKILQNDSKMKAYI